MERRGLAKGLKAWVNVVFFLTVAGAGAIIIMWPISGFSDGAGFDLSIPVAIGEGSLPSIHRLEVSARTLREDLEGLSNPRLVRAKAELRFQGRMIEFSLVFWLLMIITFGLLVLGLQLLRKILATAAEGRPFDPQNVKRLNYLGWLITASGVAVPFAQFTMTRWILSRFKFTPLPLSPPIEVRKEWILCGLLVLVLASVRKEAVRLAEEESLTV